MYESLEIKATFPVSAATLYNAWLDGATHAAMTGGAAEGKAEEGSAFYAWDGYITGSILNLIPNQEIHQSWRSTDFTDEDEDSDLILRFREIAAEETELTLIHTSIPEGQTQYEEGWLKNYIEPMRAYFAAKK